MENEIQSNIPSVQMPLQTLTQVSPTTNWKKIVLFILLGLVAIAGLTYVGIQIYKNQIFKQQPVVIEPTVSPSQTLQMLARTNPYQVSLKLINSYSGDLIKNKRVTIDSLMSCMLIDSECLRNAKKSYSSDTNNEGILIIPKNVIYTENDELITIEDKAFSSEIPNSISADIFKSSSENMPIEIEVNPIKEIIKNGNTTSFINYGTKLKLFDKITHSQLANLRYWISSTNDCTIDNCPNILEKGFTNRLGNIFYDSTKGPHPRFLLVEGYQLVSFSWQDEKLFIPKNEISPKND